MKPQPFLNLNLPLNLNPPAAIKNKITIKIKQGGGR